MSSFLSCRVRRKKGQNNGNFLNILECSRSIADDDAAGGGVGACAEALPVRHYRAIADATPVEPTQISSASIYLH